MNRSKINNLDNEATRYVVVYLDADIVSEGYKTKRQAQRRVEIEREFDEDERIELLSIEDFNAKYKID